MFKYLVLVFVLLSHGILEYAVGYPSRSKQVKDLQSLVDTNLNCSAITEEMSKKLTVTMNGNSNYHVGQQIFYVYDEQQFRQLFSDSTHTEIVEKGYLVTPNIGAHKLHPRKITWNNARRACIDEGGHLAIINSISEEKILLRMLKERNIVEAYVGLHDLYEEGDWVTVTDEPFESTGYTRWTTTFANLPDNFGGSQNCGVIREEGGLDDVHCGLTHSFFCEITL
ncbi:PREDICTED: hemolymph lipopolysaccharide-binding protein-like [Dinoponera quadriceps]|uniref:Hemolymph lipopolysaccharide-binding protein-like n=1 Tax=Dinoponera quadriceps TaxID=609295 RepID=A0A6P3YD41_DINQU|nr:PREDICTED: hemolymph lipopolysaccharide-binding protein-like [Dinoponera quadriceps]